MQEYSVYQITNKINGKKYFGYTNCPKDRWSEHQKPGFAGRPITDAILEFGAQNFEFKVVAKTELKCLAKSLESELIYNYNSIYPNGYNRVQGTNKLSRGLYISPKYDKTDKARGECAEIEV